MIAKILGTAIVTTLVAAAAVDARPMGAPQTDPDRPRQAVSAPRAISGAPSGTPNGSESLTDAPANSGGVRMTPYPYQVSPFGVPNMSEFSDTGPAGRGAVPR